MDIAFSCYVLYWKIYVNIQSFNVWYQHEERKLFLMTDNSVFNLVTPSGIFTDDAKLMFFSPTFFFLQWIKLLVLNNVWIQVYLICSYTFYCYYLFAVFMKLHTALTWIILWACSKQHVVRSDETTGGSHEMLPTCSKLNPMELVLYSSRGSTGKFLSASDPSPNVQPSSHLQPSLHAITSFPDHKTHRQPAAGMCVSTPA